MSTILAQAYADMFFGPRPANVAWIIDKDYLFDGGTMPDEAGIAGPGEAPDELIERLKADKNAGVKFRMFDDDDELYYSGRVIAIDTEDGTEMAYPDCGEEFFRPLEDFGMPNAGCTSIQYRNTNTGKWETL